jgi:hypothetical protein
MTFSFALLGALVLLLPGFAGYYGLRVGEATNLVSPYPDRPNSNQTIFIVVLLALFAHMAGSILFTLNDFIALRASPIIVPFETNPYRALWFGRLPDRFSSAALTWELCYFCGLTIATGWVLRTLARTNRMGGLLSSLRFGWLQPMARQIEAGSHVVIGYVMTRLGHDGAWIAYEGIVRRLALTDDDAIEMIILEQCDRFVVRIVDGRVERVNSEGQTIALIQLRNDQVANYALETLAVAQEP